MPHRRPPVAPDFRWMVERCAAQGSVGDLSEPFQSNLPQGQLQTAEQTAQRLLKVRDGLTPAVSGALLHWDGSVLPF